jgi:uncharacterized protein
VSALARTWSRVRSTRGTATRASDADPLDQPLPLHPIDPAWIERGTPVARGMNLTESPDGRLSSGLWECSAGQFKWTFGLDEVAHILGGEVTIREDGDAGDTYTLRRGDVAYFPLGLTVHWDIPDHVRKFFVVRVPGGNRRIARVRQRFAI